MPFPWARNIHDVPMVATQERGSVPPHTANVEEDIQQSIRLRWCALYWRGLYQTGVGDVSISD